METSGSLLASEGRNQISNDMVTVSNTQTVAPSFLAGNVAPDFFFFSVPPGLGQGIGVSDAFKTG